MLPICFAVKFFRLTILFLVGFGFLVLRFFLLVDIDFFAEDVLFRSPDRSIELGFEFDGRLRNGGAGDFTFGGVIV